MGPLNYDCGSLIETVLHTYVNYMQKLKHFVQAHKSSNLQHEMLYRKQGKIRWAKLLHFAWFSRMPQVFCEYLFILYKLRTMALFKCLNIRHRESFSVKTFLDGVHKS